MFKFNKTILFGLGTIPILLLIIFSVPHTPSVIVIEPKFTELAYEKNGFYDYYSGKCKTCYKIDMLQNETTNPLAASSNGLLAMHNLGFYTITDIELDKNPDIIYSYRTVILLHNEYVTKKEYDAISVHPYVIYLYANALYAQVNYTDRYVQLVRGHGYPDKSISNGFGWKEDNSHYEYDRSCETKDFRAISNGIMLDCNPDYVVASGPFVSNLLKYLK